MNFLRQSTATDIGIGPFVDNVDGNTPETGLTITAPDIRLKKNGGAWAQKNAAQTLSHEENGWYEVALDTTDTNTLGILIVAIHESGALPVWKDYQVLPANVFDSLVSGSDKLQTDAVEISGDSTAADNCELFFDGTGYTAANSEIGFVGMVNSLDANVINAASIAANAITDAKVAADVTIASVTGAVGSVTGSVGSVTGAVGSVTGAVGSVTGAVGSVTGAVGSVTAMVTANVIQISGDATAADDFETMLDGTGGKTLTLKNVVINNGAGVGLAVTGSTYAAQFTGPTAGLFIFSATGPALQISAALNVGMLVSGGSTFPAFKAVADGTGAGMELVGGTVSGAGMHIHAGGSGNGLLVEGDGILADIDATIDGNLTGSVLGSVNNVVAVGSGAITSGSFAAGAINAAAIAPDSIGASELATSAVSEIVAGIGGVGAFAITVTVNDGAAALQNVAVTVVDNVGAIAGRGTTNASGQADLSLAAGTYTVALVKPNYVFAPVSRTVTGNQAGSIINTLSMTIVVPIAASIDPDLCVVAGYIKDLNGNPLVGSLVKARLVPPNPRRPITSNGNVLGLEADTAITDGLGHVSMELIRTDEISPDGCTYVFKCEDAKMEKHNITLTTPTRDIATL